MACSGWNVPSTQQEPRNASSSLSRPMTLTNFIFTLPYLLNPSFRRSGSYARFARREPPSSLISHADKHPTDLLSRNLIADAFDDMRNIINLVLCEKHKAEHHNTRVRRKTKILQAAAILQLCARTLNEGENPFKFPAIGRCISALPSRRHWALHQQFKLACATCSQANHHRARISSGEPSPIRLRR